jgi:[ribosomal protein S5]-alanine N-acetyltransferase
LIATSRLDLLPNTIATTQAALSGTEALGSALGARVPSTWPPDFLDAAAFEFLLERLRVNPTHAEWWNYFIILRGKDQQRVLIGTVGYKGPPTEGMVEIGYGIVSEHRRKGYATEAALALIERAFSFPEVSRVTAETLPDLAPSIRVMRRCGLRFVGEGSEAGTVRYQLDRPSTERHA